MKLLILFFANFASLLVSADVATSSSSSSSLRGIVQGNYLTAASPYAVCFKNCLLVRRDRMALCNGNKDCEKECLNDPSCNRDCLNACYSKYCTCNGGVDNDCTLDPACKPEEWDENANDTASRQWMRPVPPSRGIPNSPNIRHRGQRWCHSTFNHLDLGES